MTLQNIEQTPEFSVVIPIYNRQQEAELALKPFLLPKARGIEVIVVDDGSTDNTAQVVQNVAKNSSGATIHLVRQDNAGPGAARNTGVSIAKSDWILFLDSDDQWMPWTIHTFRQILNAPATAESKILFWQATSFFDDSELSDVEQTDLSLRRHPTMLDMRLNDPLPLVASCNMGIRKQAFLALEGFCQDVNHSEDTDLLYRANELGDVAVIAEPVMMGYRQTKSGTASQTNSGSAVRRKRVLYLLNRFKGGHYPGPPEKVYLALSRTSGYAIRGYFAKGFISAAYIVYIQSVGVFFRAGRWGDLIKLPLTPVLSLIRPSRYRFRIRKQF